jgi:hypothetical protein
MAFGATVEWPACHLAGSTPHIDGVKAALEGGGRTATVRAVDEKGAEKCCTVDVRVDTPQEVEYYRNGGILPYVLRRIRVYGAGYPAAHGIVVLPTALLTVEGTFPARHSYDTPRRARCDPVAPLWTAPSTTINRSWRKEFQ